jgi:malate synthase
MAARKLEFRGNLESAYADVFTPEARARNKQRIDFEGPQATIARTKVKIQDARAGDFIGSAIPRDLLRQWIQGTGPAAKPNAHVENSIRNVAYALLSGADGWMFDGEDALGQISTMSLDNQRNLKLAIHPDRERLEKAARFHDQDLSRARPAS